MLISQPNFEKFAITIIERVVVEMRISKKLADFQIYYQALQTREDPFDNLLDVLEIPIQS